jgi:hypothetical protein
MSPSEYLRSALSGVDWNKYVGVFLKSDVATESVANANRQLALWATVLAGLEPESPANGFLYGMQSEGHYVAALIALALYKPAASSMRAVVEAALYYSYFRNHPVELGTLIREPSFFVEKASIVEFHKTHTVDFAAKQAALNLVGGLNSWYSQVSAVIHGQVPGAWVEHTELSKISPTEKMQSLAMANFQEAVGIVNSLFLVCVSQDDWNGIPKSARQEFLRGLSGPSKKILGLSVG